MKKIIRAFIRPIHNKKGFTFIEAIAVVAIMGVLAVVIGGLLTSSTTAYIRQKEAASAKDLSAIVEKEIARKLTAAKEVYLVNGALPTGEDIVIDNINYIFNDDSVPFKLSNDVASAFYSQEGQLMYRELDSDAAGEAYFTETEAEKRAFYGSYSVVVSFGAVQNGNGVYNSLLIYADVYKSDKKIYTSPGRNVTFLEAMNPSGSSGIVHATANIPSAFSTDEIISETEYHVSYIDLLVTDGISTYTHMYFI